MTNIQAFEKILHHQENLKNEAQLEYTSAVSEFETVAEELYQLLKQKETIEDKYQQALHTSGSVTSLMTHHTYLQQLKKRIRHVETTVNEKRSIMEGKRLLLTDQHVEVKKYEKIIDHKWELIKTKEKETESKMLDEASIRQYYNHGDR
ncbi:hypothetical protein HMI01_04220 [Halolactibacillus miurensis]|uniref:Flagellar FliJ protein n=1 Tax=Halolactibacillus miurensis TaxID=306541 RepID=A0A1I6QDU1_9BACI|nr:MULTISPECIES: flagellar export protein FliJ [Halolactibacillus]GEM03434.1 hypothetical protein HMI01_04220 [Halolactibacillus miurensis]SFS50614.1 flagellar FliJ protein [Halolactibacillus miurensis]